jgi:hypothetical protein
MKRKKMKNIEARETNGRKRFSTPQVLEFFDLKAGRLRQWVKLGYIIPTKKATGSGSTAYFDINALYRIGLFMKLCNAGFNRYISSNLANEIYYEIIVDHFSYDEILYAVIDWTGEPNKDKNWRKNIQIYPLYESELDLKDIQMAVVLNLNQIIEDIDGKVSA